MKRFRIFSRRAARVALLALLAVVLCAGAALAVFRAVVLDEAKMQAEIVSALTEATGMQVELSEVSLHFWPRPHLSLHTLSMTDAGISAQAEEIWGTLLWLPLIRGRFSVREAGVEHPQIRVAALSEVGGMVRRLRERTGARPPSAGGAEWLVRELEVRDISVLAGEVPVLAGDAQLSGLRTDNAELQVQLAVPRAGEEAILSGALLIAGSADGRTLSGTLRLQGADTGTLMGTPAEFSWQGSLRARAEETPLHAPEFSLDGALARDGDALAFSGLAWWAEGRIGLGGVQLKGEGIEGAAEATINFGEESAVKVSRLVVSSAHLEPLLARAPEGLGLRVAEEAELEVSDLLLGVAGKQLRVVEGKAAIGGIALGLAGAAEPLSGIAGEVTARENVFDLKLGAEDFSLSGSLSPDFAARQLGVKLQGEITTAKLISLFPVERLGAPEGLIELSGLDARLGMGNGPAPEFQAAVRLKDVGLSVKTPAQEAPLQLKGVGGEVFYEEGRFRIEKLEGEGVNVSGTVQPDWTARQFAVALHGTLDLATGLLQPWIPAATVQGLKGRLDCSEFSGTFGAGGIPADLRIAGALENGAAKLTLGKREDAWSGVSASFETSAETVVAKVSLDSERMGKVGFDGTYLPAPRSLEGSVRASLARVLGVWLQGKAGAYAQSFARESGVIDAHMQATLPTAKVPALALEARQTEGGDLSLGLLLQKQDEAWRVERLKVSGEIPLRDPDGVLPLGLQAEGRGVLEVSKEAGSPRFAVRGNLDQAELVLGKYLKKAPGVQGSFEMTGDAGGKTWKPDEMLLRCSGQSLRLVPQDAAWMAPDLSVDLAPLSPLFQGTQSATGTVSGSITTQPAQANLFFKDVVVSLAPGVEVQTSGGSLKYQAGRWEVEGVHIGGEKNDFVLGGAFGPEGWSGTMTGASLNLNALLELPQALQQPGSGSTAPAGKSGRSTLVADIGQVHFRRAVLEDVHAEMSSGAGEFVVDKLHFRPHKGSVDGRIRRVAVEGGPPRVFVNFAFQDADMRVFEEVLLNEPRDLAGTMSGSAELQFNSGKGLEILNSLDGNLQYSARDGSYGRLGWATRLIAVLKTTEIIRLRLPSWNDSGLSFRKSEVDLAFSAGKMQVRRFTATDRAYSMEGEGTVDFPANDSAVEFRVYLLESVTGLIGQLPVLRSTVNLFKKVSGIRMKMSGPPLDPSIRPDPVLLPDRQQETVELPPEPGQGESPSGEPQG